MACRLGVFDKLIFHMFSYFIGIESLESRNKSKDGKAAGHYPF